MVQQRRTFTEDFKRKAVNLAKESGKKPAHLGHSYHVPCARGSCSGFYEWQGRRQASDSLKMIGSSRRFGKP